MTVGMKFWKKLQNHEFNQSGLFHKCKLPFQNWEYPYFKNCSKFNYYAPRVYAWSILCQFPVLNFWLDHNGSRHIYDCTSFLQVAKRRGIFRLINSGNKLTTDKIVQRIIAHRYAKALTWNETWQLSTVALINEIEWHLLLSTCSSLVPRL